MERLFPFIALRGFLGAASATLGNALCLAIYTAAVTLTVRVLT